MKSYIERLAQFWNDSGGKANQGGFRKQVQAAMGGQVPPAARRRWWHFQSSQAGAHQHSMFLVHSHIRKISQALPSVTSALWLQ